MDINKDKKHLVMYLLVIILLVFLFFWAGDFLKNRANDTTNNQDTKLTQKENITEENNVDNTTENTIQEEQKTDLSVIQSDVDKKEYDKLMILASDAYNNKNYGDSLDFYNKALKIQELDVVYGKMYLVYKAMGDNNNAFLMLAKAMGLKPTFNQYWIWEIESKRDVGVGYDELYKIYQEGIDKVELTAKVNFVVFFARVSEEMKQNDRAIELWEYAKELYPPSAEIYQGEIDKLQA